MGKERIRKAAKRLNISVDEILTALSSLGHGRYRLPDDMLPDPVVADLERALRKRTGAPKDRPLGPPPRTTNDGAATARRTSHSFSAAMETLPGEISDDPALNVTLQEYRAAQPLAELRGRLTPKTTPPKTSPPPSPPPTPTRQSTESMLRESLGVEIRQRRLVTESLELARSELAKARADAAALERKMASELEKMREQMAQREQEIVALHGRAQQDLLEREASMQETIGLLRSELSQTAASEREYRTRCEQVTKSEQLARKDLESIRVRLASEMVAKQVAEGQLDQIQRRMREMQDRVVSAPPPLPTPTPSPAPVVPKPDLPSAVPLDEVFERRGLTEPAEVRAAFEILLRSGSYFDTMELLATISPAALERCLTRKISLLCENCDPPVGSHPIRLDAHERCEVCKGQSVSMGIQAFAAACSNLGISSVNLVGGPPRSRVDLAETLGPHVQVNLVDPPTHLERDWPSEVVARADLTLLWGDSFLDHRVPGLFRELNDKRVIHVVHRGPGGLLRLAARALAEQKPASTLWK